VYGLTAPYTFVWRRVEALVTPHVSYGTVLFIPVTVLFGASLLTSLFWLGAVSWCDRIRRHR
jgi:hypothetical protein